MNFSRILLEIFPNVKRFKFKLNGKYILLKINQLKCFFEHLSINQWNKKMHTEMQITILIINVFTQK